MAMQKQTWSISGISVELGIDRRTLAKKLDSLEPVEVKGKSRLYHLADVIRRLDLFDKHQPTRDELEAISEQKFADEVACFFDLWAPALTQYLWEEAGQPGNIKAEHILRIVQKIWAIQLEALKNWCGLENLDLVDIPDFIEALKDPDRFELEASLLTGFGKPKAFEESDIDLSGLLSEIELSES